MCYLGCDYAWKVTHPVYQIIECPSCKEEGKSETNAEKRAKQKSEREASINRPTLNLLFTNL